MQNFLTTSDTTDNTHPDILLTHGQTTALLPIYDHNKIYSYTYRNIARTPIEVSGARRMTRQHSHLGPVFFQCPQLVSSSQKNQRQFNLYQSPRTCRGKDKWLSFNDIILERTFMIQFRYIPRHKQLLLSFQLRPIQSTAN